MPNSYLDIETAPFDGGCLAHNIATGALCRLNQTAAEILAMMQGGHSEAEAAGQLARQYAIAEDAAARDVATLVTGWKASGLTRAEDEAGEIPEDLPAAAPRFTPALDVTVSCGGPAVQVTSEEEELSGLLAEVLAPASVAGGDNVAAPENRLQLSGAEGDFCCWCGDTLLWRYGLRPVARRLLLQEVIRRSLPGGPPAAILHASAVLMEDQAVILAGTTGSGKSTLTAGLVAAGGKLIADDLLPLGMAGGGVWPVPFALSAKEGSWPVLEPLFAGFDRLRTLTSRGLNVRYLAPALAERGLPVRANAVVFPQWAADAKTETGPVTQTEIADQLIATGTDLLRRKGAVAEFAAFADGLSGYRIAYPTLHEGIDSVRAILSSGTD